MRTSKLQANTRIPMLEIDGESMAAMAYTTYFEERSCYEDFIEAGYRLFFVNVSFTGVPINSVVSGWQLCGGQTQEWFHHDLFGSLCPSANRTTAVGYGIPTARKGPFCLKGFDTAAASALAGRVGGREPYTGRDPRSV